MPSHADVVVVGAGPAGSATALRLARLGHRVTIVDRARFPRPKPCGEYLNPAAVSALDRLGVLTPIAGLGTALSGMLLAGPDGTAAWIPFPSGRGLLVPRDRLDHTLLRAAAAAGAEVIEECRIDAATPGPVPSVTGRCRGHPVHLTARLVIGADGLRSVVARRAGPLSPAVGGRYTIGAHFEGLDAEVPRGDLHLGPGWYVGAAIYGRGRGNVVAAVPRSAFRRAGRRPEDLFAWACDALPALRPIMRGARRATPFVSVGPLGFTRRPAAAEGVLLVGDAAGTIDPMTGEGIALALRSAELAAAAADRALRDGSAFREAIASYEPARAAAFGDIWRTSRALQWIVRRPALAAVLFRRLAADPRLGARLLGVVSGLGGGQEVLSAGFLVRLVAGRSA